MPKRINGGLAVAATGAALLIVSLFLDWYSGRSAWTSFELNDLLLAVVGVLVLGVAAGDAFAGPSGRRYVPEGSVVWGGAGALVIVVGSLIQPPPGLLHSSREVGAWLGLAATLLITGGGLLMRARISLVIALKPSDRARRAARAEDASAYQATGAAYEPEAYPPEDEAPTAYEPELPAEDYEPPEPAGDPDTETRRLYEPPD